MNNDLISRDTLIADIKRVFCTGCNSYDGVRCRACGTGDALDMVEDASAVDAVQVVRCRDCENWTKMQDSAQGKCWLTGDYPTGSWYCANGRLKCEEEANG